MSDHKTEMGYSSQIFLTHISGTKSIYASIRDRRAQGGPGGMGGAGGMGGPMDFGRSKSKFQETPETGVSFDDVAGCDGAKLELQEVVDFLKNPGEGLVWV